MTCDEARSLLSAYLAKEVVGRQKSQLKKHLQGCQDCRNILAEFKKTTTLSKYLPKTKPTQDLPDQSSVKTKRFHLPSLIALGLLLVAGLAVYLVLSSSPSNKPISEFRLLSEDPVQAQKAIRDLVELLDGTILPKKETGRIATPTPPTAAEITEEDILLISIPIKTQDFFLEKLLAFGTLESVSSAEQLSRNKLDDSSMVTLKLTIGVLSPTPQQK